MHNDKNDEIEFGAF